MRESIWTVRVSWYAMYFTLFAVQIAGAIAYIAWLEVANVENENAYDAFDAIIRGSSSFVIVAAATSLIAVEVIGMIGDRLFRQRYIQEGRTQERKLWEDWNRRREEAAAKGESFDEPPPSTRELREA